MSTLPEIEKWQELMSKETESELQTCGCRWEGDLSGLPDRGDALKLVWVVRTS